VSSFSLSSLDVAQKTAQVQIGVCTQRAWGGNTGMWMEDDYRHCSVSARSTSSTIGWPGGIFLGLAAFLISRRRRAV
jgi:hypothetical protein